MPSSVTNGTNGTNGTATTELQPNNTHGFATRAVHAGQDPTQWRSQAVVPPISLATTFQQPEPAEPVEFDYSRSGNPTRKCLETALASLENAKYAMTFSSGLATINTITHMLNHGDHIVSCEDLYGGTGRQFRQCATKMGIELSFVDPIDIKSLVSAVKPNTRLIWLETPTNPMLQMCDISEIVKQVRKLNTPDLLIAVDNTFMSPYFQNPLSLGADLVMHSVTKYLNGHSDVVMGCIMTSNPTVYEKLAFLQNAIGAVPSPFDCFLVNRGLKTLSLRMERHQQNALQVAQFLESHPSVEKVLYPGLKTHPQHELAKRQCTGFSGMISLYLKGDAAFARRFVKNLKLFCLAESLGAVESLVEIPSVMTHASHPKEVREKLGITDQLIRISIGIEEVKDLIQDLDQALKRK